MAVIIAFIFGVLLIAAPIVLSVFGINVGTGTQITMTSVGSAMILFSGVAFVFTRLYHKTKASEAFVRTGQGGAKVIQDGGAVIVPFIHELVRVSLQTVRIDVKRDGAEALITHDKLRADIHAQFFVRVNPKEDSILQASRSVGDATNFNDAVKVLVEDKLVSALRSAAAMKTLEDLNSERQTFLEEVTKILQHDLASNGLVLETVTISNLDQTDPKFLKNNNIFDAQGSRKIAEITESSATERNQLVRAGEQARKQQDVENRKRILSMEQEQKQAEATQSAEVQSLQATSVRDAQTKVIEMERETQLATIEKQRALEVAEKQREQALALAEEAKAQAVQLAQQAKEREVAIAREGREQATLVAQQLKETAGASARAEKAEALRILALKEAEVQTAQQSIETIKITQEAERSKAKGILEAQADAERSLVKSKAESDAMSYQIETTAASQKAAADAQAEAVLKKAQAESEADKLRASAEKTRAMVPVEVRKAEVDVERERVETVIKPELEAREKHGKVAQDFEIAKLQVSAEKEVRIATANAQATMFSRIDAKLYGTPDQVNAMIRSFGEGQNWATKVEGLLENVSEETKSQLGGLAKQLTAIATDAVRPSAPQVEKPQVREPKKEKDLSAR
jgi:uncharacterized membrane protein YqiK